MVNRPGLGGVRRTLGVKALHESPSRYRVEFEPDDLQQVPSPIGTDGENPGRVSGRLKFDDGEGVFKSVQDRLAVEAVLERRAMELHTQLM